jgi:dissimilatory sulfite reductase (desulfoviridin) alpha/beta subunit
MINISKNKCVGCGICESNCPTGAITVDKNKGIAVIDMNECTGCENCLQNCPQEAVKNIEREYTIAIGTDDEKVIKADDHVGMSKYFQIWKYSDGNLNFVETRENVKYKEDEGRIHGDPGKAKATASAVGGVNVLVGKMMGPNIERLRHKFVPVIIRQPEIKEALEIIKNSINEIAEAFEKENRQGIVLN